MAAEEGVTVKKSNFSEWYPQVLIKSGFIDYTDVSGALAFRPSAYATWQAIVEFVDKKFREVGIENVYFPVFIPEKFLKMESDHFSGFVPEVAWVTEAGDSKLGERLAVRPTSETIMYASYSKWVRSWRDLPMRYNQWNNVVRWEFKHPTPFIRNREFLWNEGHTVFATEKEALGERDQVLGIYMKALKDCLALPGILGKKTDKEKFAGAIASYSIEMMMPDGWAIQGPDFHFDGQNFAKAFDIKFLDREGKTDYAWQNTFAISTRVIGIMIATHGDDKGLVLPPKVANIQIVVVPIYKKENQEKVISQARNISKLLSEYRVRLDDREGYSPGHKFNEWELRGVPIRIELGERDIDAKKITVVRRDTGEKTECPETDVKLFVDKLLKDIHDNLYRNAEKFLNESVHRVLTYEEFKITLEKKKGFMHAPWCGNGSCEDKIKEETGAKITNMPFDGQKLTSNKCIYCGKEAKYMANFARSY